MHREFDPPLAVRQPPGSWIAATVALALVFHPAAQADIQTERLRVDVTPPVQVEASSTAAQPPSETTPKALFRLALSYDLGRGVPQDHARAFSLYRQAAERGHVGSALSVGLMLNQGQGVPVDQNAGFQWLRRAADQGSVDGQYSVGVVFMQGQGVERDYESAASWFRRAAQHGHAEAMNNLGVILANGLGARSDPVQAYAWFKLASMAGSKDGEENRRVSAQELAPSDVKAGDELAEEIGAELGV